MSQTESIWHNLKFNVKSINYCITMRFGLLRTSQINVFLKWVKRFVQNSNIRGRYLSACLKGAFFSDFRISFDVVPFKWWKKKSNFVGWYFEPKSKVIWKVEKNHVSNKTWWQGPPYIIEIWNKLISFAWTLFSL